jgi:hypothetical protein
MLEYITNTVIDTVQSTKKTAIDTFVKHEAIAKTLHGLVDAETEYTKRAAEAAFTAGSGLASTLSEKGFYADAFKAHMNEVKSWLPGVPEVKFNKTCQVHGLGTVSEEGRDTHAS